MERIEAKDITVTRHMADGFTLSYLADSGEYYHRRYIDYSLAEAKRKFMRHVRYEESKIVRCVPAPHVAESQVMKMLGRVCGA
jgi:hypothetical protein